MKNIHVSKISNIISQSIYCIFLFLCLFIGCYIRGHGFAEGTYVKSVDVGWFFIEKVCKLTCKRKNIYVKSYDFYSNATVNQRVRIGAESETNCYIRIGFNHQRSCDLLCTPSQEFYNVLLDDWVPACDLKAGDMLLSQYNGSMQVVRVELIKEPLKVYSIEVKNTHNFFVGEYSILTHNFVMPFVTIGIGFSFGSGAAAGGTAGGFFGPITFAGGIALGGLVGIIVNSLTTDTTVPHYRLEYDLQGIDTHIKNQDKQSDKKVDDKKADDKNGAQAPGKPTKDDGFFPPKGWDGKKVKNPNGPGFWVAR